MLAGVRQSCGPTSAGVVVFSRRRLQRGSVSRLPERGLSRIQRTQRHELCQVSSAGAASSSESGEDGTSQQQDSSDAAVQQQLQQQQRILESALASTSGTDGVSQAAPARSSSGVSHPQVPWGVGKIVQVMGLWLLAYIAMGQLLVPTLLALLDVSREELSHRGAALLHLGLDVAELLVTVGILALCTGRYRPRALGLFPLRWDGGRWLGWVAAGAASFPLVDWLAQQSLLLLAGPEAVAAAAGGGGGGDVWSAQLEASLCGGDWVSGLAYLSVVSVCAPVWEEAIFRGFLQASLMRVMPPAGATLASALLFALCHFKLATFAPLLVLGLVFGGVYTASGNLLPPIVLHSLWNMYVLATLAWRSGGCCGLG